MDDFVGKDHAVESPGEAQGAHEHQDRGGQCQSRSRGIAAQGQDQDRQGMEHLVPSGQLALIELLGDLLLRKAFGLELFGQAMGAHGADAHADCTGEGR